VAGGVAEFIAASNPHPQLPFYTQAVESFIRTSIESSNISTDSVHYDPSYQWASYKADCGLKRILTRYMLS
jgi:hypothetical protein